MTLHRTNTLVGSASTSHAVGALSAETHADRCASQSRAAAALPASDDDRPAYVFYFADNVRAAVFHHASIEHPNARAAVERLRSRGYVIAGWPEYAPLPTRGGLPPRARR